MSGWTDGSVGGWTCGGLVGWRLVRLVGVWWIEGRYLDIDKLAERDR